MFKLFFTLTGKLEFLPTAFAVILTPVALSIIPKVEFNFKEIMYITIFVSEVRKAALNLQSVIETYLKALRSSCFLGGCRKKNFFTRTFWGLCTPWSSILRPPEHWFVLFLSILKPKAVIYPLGMKTRPWQVFTFGPQRAMIACTFRAYDFKKKNRLSRTPKVLWKYAQKVHSDWFICPQEQ